jgi:hypothetical protein
MKQLLFLLGAFLCATVSFAQGPAWKQFQAPGKASLRGLAPISDQVCWASGSGGTWLKTEDGGASWQTGTVAGLDTVDFRSIHAFDSKTAVVASAGQPAVIYRTEWRQKLAFLAESARRDSWGSGLCGKCIFYGSRCFRAGICYGRHRVSIASLHLCFPVLGGP